MGMYMSAVVTGVSVLSHNIYKCIFKVELGENHKPKVLLIRMYIITHYRVNPTATETSTDHEFKQ